nr:immunoglobulin light chain junction region [Macaca mulatta]MOW56851.1 immunoglobulin light chain junction region [Macaca mulatta]MOW57046.1 immunoglobulin light chain junction region [Macaca mulatta]MOW57069.1 immunoglobulin light chain junction region [Macaca mulatta]MOW57322.1 immunoglobulin light chain junction region [Macaca mulatta]
DYYCGSWDNSVNHVF